jgi:hypothetical protein
MRVKISGNVQFLSSALTHSIGSANHTLTGSGHGRMVVHAFLVHFLVRSMVPLRLQQVEHGVRKMTRVMFQFVL